MIRSVINYLRRKRRLASPKPGPQYEIGTLHSHSRGKRIPKTPDSPGRAKLEG